MALAREHQLRADLEAATRGQSEFAAVLAHELRQPLAPLITAATMIAQRNDGSTEQFRQVIERQTGHLSRLLDDVADLSHFQLGRLNIRPSATTVAALVDDAVQAVEPLMAARGHRFAVAVTPSTVLEADVGRIRQVLSNLLVNAVKFTDPGGDIQLTVVLEGKDVLFCVRDSGRGIAPDVLPTVFELFQQGPGREEGLGIGLAVVKALTEAHGGSVHAFSRGLGEGSEFVVRLPLAQGPNRGGTLVSVSQQSAERRRATAGTLNQ